MQNLSIINLHFNIIIGDLNYLIYVIKSFILDFSSTKVFKVRLDYLDYSEYQNIDSDYVIISNIQQRNIVKSIEILPDIFIVLLLIGVLFILIITIIFIRIIGIRFTYLPYIVKHTFQQNLVNRQFLSSSKIAWFITSLFLLF